MNLKLKLGPVAKTVVACVAAAGTALNVAVGDNVLDVQDLIQIGLAVATVAGVYAVPNKPSHDK